LPPTGDYFGSRAIELAGIIVDPDLQQKGVGTDIVREFVRDFSPERMIAYTRNPSILRLLGKISYVADVLAYDLASIAVSVPHASVHDGYVYHIDRYAPAGLYGGEDPATRQYRERILKERCVLLENPNNALAISVNLKEGGDHV